MDFLPFLDATAQADLVRRKEASPRELVDAAIARIERLNPALNAVITPLFDEARKAAAGPLPDGPFTGVPFLLKDLMAEAAGAPHAEGSAFLAGHVSPEDSELVRRYRRAGLVLVGKTNTPELGLLPTTEPRRFGPTKNPWDRTRTAGGSSGGSAAAVAAGLVPAAHGNDGGGSIRIPAACCGVFGLKPTRGRTPLELHPAHIWRVLVVEHALTRSVRDSAALLDATSGPVAGDPHGPPAPRRPFRDEVGADPGRLRIALTTRAATGAPVHPDCAEAAQAAAALCARLGHEVVEAAPALDGDALTQAFMRLWAAGCAWTVDAWARRLDRVPAAGHFEGFTWALYQMGKAVSAPDYLAALEDLRSSSESVAAFFRAYDLWLTPTLAEPPLPLGQFESASADSGDAGASGGDPMHALFRSATFVPFTPIANMTGHPAMSVPLHWNREDLPIGVHFVGRFGDEATLFRLAGQLEAARPWAARRPPVG